MKLHLRLYKYSINIHNKWENERIQRLRISTVTPCDNGVNWLTSKHRQKFSLFSEVFAPGCDMSKTNKLFSVVP